MEAIFNFPARHLTSRNQDTWSRGRERILGTNKDVLVVRHLKHVTKYENLLSTLGSKK